MRDTKEVDMYELMLEFFWRFGLGKRTRINYVGKFR